MTDEEFAEHQTANIDCCECWKGPSQCLCGGLIHRHFFDESDDSVLLTYRCDKCGSTETPEDE